MQWAVLPPQHQVGAICWVSGSIPSSHPSLRNALWQQCAPGARPAPAAGSAWRAVEPRSVALSLCVATSTWGVSKHWEPMTCQIYECFLYQQMFADRDSPELRFPLFSPSDLLIRADNGNPTFFHRQRTESKRKFSEEIGAGGTPLALKN